MSHRIELTFVGEAPENELERSKILGHPDFEKVVREAHETFATLGWVSDYTIRTVRHTDRKPRAIHGRLKTPDEFAADALTSKTQVNYVPMPGNSQAAE